MLSTNKQHQPTSPLSQSLLTITTAPLSTNQQSQQQSPLSNNNSLLTSTAYTILNALIKILSNSEKITRKQQQQIDYLINYWKNFDSKSIQVNSFCLFSCS